MDGSVVRSHACAAGAANSSADNEALGHSKDGFSCKIHALCEALGMPTKYILTYWHYKERHVVECMFGKLKHYRRIAARYEKKAINYMGMLSFSSILLWLR